MAVQILEGAVRAVRAVAVKDLRVAFADRALIALGVLLPVNILLLFMLFVSTGGEAPTDVVVADHGPVADRLVAALAGSHSFHLYRVDARRAQSDLTRGDVVAVITVPAGFGDAVAAGRTVELPVAVNNLETDYTNDIRRAVPLAITSFYAESYPGRVAVRAKEIDVQPHDTGYIGYLSVSVLALGMIVSGVLQGALGTAREDETATVKELLLAPVPRWAIVTGKMLGALIVDLITTLVLVAVVVVGFGQQPARPALLVGYWLLLAVSSVALGTLLGTLIPRRMAVLPLVMLSVVPTLFLSGPFGPPNWLGRVSAAIATASPLTYAISGLQDAVHGYRTWWAGTAGSALVLAGFGMVCLLLSVWALRRHQVRH
jgi:ABC-type transport system involved in multi-copper enzyme maturation permease subunit